MSTPKFLFLHIPKTAGSTFSAVLCRNFGKLFYRDALFYADTCYEPWQVRHALSIRPHLCWASHALRATSLPHDQTGRLRAIVFVRSPISHAISGYLDMRGRVGDAQHVAVRYSLEEVSRRWREKDYNKLWTGYTFSQFEWLYPQIEDKMEMLRNDLKIGRLMIFPTEKINDALLFLERIFPDYFKDCRYPYHKNISPRDYHVDEKDTKEVRLLPWMSLDQSLHEEAHQYLDKRLGEAFPDRRALPEARKDFAQRCRPTPKDRLGRLLKNQLPWFRPPSF